MPSFFQKHYAKGSPDRKALEDALHKFGQGTLEVPTVIDGKEVSIPESCTMSEDAIIPKIIYAGGKAHKLRRALANSPKAMGNTILDPAQPRLTP